MITAVTRAIGGVADELVLEKDGAVVRSVDCTLRMVQGRFTGVGLGHGAMDRDGDLADGAHEAPWDSQVAPVPEGRGSQGSSESP